MRKTPASRWASWSAGSSSVASERKTAVQDGSSPTTGVPASIHGRSRSSVWVRTFLAISSWPVEIQVSPQQTGPSGTATR